MESSIATIIIIAVVFIVAVQYLQTQSPSLSFDGGPLATGARDSAIQNPQPIAEPQSVFRSVRKSRVFDASSRGGIPETPAAIQPKPGYSRYEDTITISRVQRSADPRQEYVIIRNGSFFRRSEAVASLRGWTIESRKSGRIAIPAAEEIPLIDADTRPITLPPGGEIIITSGATTFGRSFRENICTDYFSENHPFTPSLASCGAIPFNAQELLDRGHNSECVDFVLNITRCRIPTIPFEKSARIGNACIEYVTGAYSYAGCVAFFRDSGDFFQNTWRVFLNQPINIFDALHDRIILRDDQGLIVDEFEY